MEPENISPTGYHSQMIKGYMLWVAATIARVSDMCIINSFQGDTSNLEQTRRKT